MRKKERKKERKKLFLHVGLDLFHISFRESLRQLASRVFPQSSQSGHKFHAANLDVDDVSVLLSFVSIDFGVGCFGIILNTSGNLMILVG